MRNFKFLLIAYSLTFFTGLSSVNANPFALSSTNRRSIKGYADAYTNPFVEAARSRVIKPPVEIDPDFIHLFGSRPKYSDYRATGRSGKEYRLDRLKWNQALKTWGGNVTQEYIDRDTEYYQTLKSFYESWNLGTPVFYIHKYRSGKTDARGALPDVKELSIRGYNAETLYTYAGQIVALVHVKMFQKGVNVEYCHPFVPSDYCDGKSYNNNWGPY